MMELALVGDAGTPNVLGWLSAWLLTYLAHSTLLLVAAWGVGRLLHPPAVREVLWKAATVGALVTASASIVLRERATSPLEPRELASSGADEGHREPSASRPLRVPATAVVGVWLATAALGVGRLESGRRRYWRQVGRRETLADPAVVGTLRRLQDGARYRRTIHVTTSDGIGAPAAIGTAEICLPGESVAALSPAQRESVLAHELGHLVRCDPLWRFAAELLAAVFVAQPLLRLAGREMRECAEMLCDDFAVQLTGRRRPLVESLTVLAAMLRPGHAAATGFGEGNSPLVLRAARVLDERRRPARRPALVAGRVLAASALLATLGFAPTVAPPAPLERGAAGFLRVVQVEVDSIGLDPAGERARGVDALGGARERRRELLVRTGAGRSPRHEYRENGRVAAPDSAARRWIADVLRRHEPR